MRRRLWLSNPLIVVTFVTFVASAVCVGILHSTIQACSVGFRTSDQPFGPGEAAQCLGYEVVVAVLIPVVLAAGGALAWVGLKYSRTGSIGGTERDDAREGDGRTTPLGRRVLGRFRRVPTHWWLAVFMVGFFAATFFAGSWQYLELVRYDIDLALNQQVLSSTLQGGKPYQFYEAYNCIQHGQCSYLLVHQAFIGYGVALVYALAPTPFTLLAIQSFIFALAAVPLYLLAVDVLGSRTLSLAVAGAYLGWLPLLILATRDTFNWECFIPVELVTVFWLWSRRRYTVAAPVVLITFLTYEVNTVLLFFVGLYFLWPWFAKAAKLLFRTIVPKSREVAAFGSRLRSWGKWIWTAFHVPEVYSSLALVVSSLVAYILLKLFVLHGGWLFGLPPVPAAYALPVGSPNEAFSFTYAYLSFEWKAKLWFWIVMYLTLGFIPLLAPRCLILVTPWIALTIFNITPPFWSFNQHYAVPAAPALLIGFTYGVYRLYRWSSKRWSRAIVGGPRPIGRGAASSTKSGVSRNPSSVTPVWKVTSPAGSPRAAAFLVVGIVVLVSANVFLSPLNPLAADIVPGFGPPFPPTYGINYNAPPSFDPLQQLVSTIPHDAIVAAPNPLFPLVANDPYAYPLLGAGSGLYNLPGNESTRVAYVLLPYNTPAGQIGVGLLSLLYNHADFGVRGCVESSGQGGIELFERDYNGTAQVFGPADTLCPNYFAGGSGLIASSDASLDANTSSPSGVVIQTGPCETIGSYPVWTGPGISLPAGTYEFHTVFSAINMTGAPCAKSNLNPKHPLLTMNITGLIGSPLKSSVFTVHTFVVGNACTSPCEWRYWNSTLTLPSTAQDVSLSGLDSTPQFEVQVAYILISPLS